jgi:polyketide synthase PksN
MYGEYQLYGAEETLKGNPMSLTSSYASIANRVSYYFDLNGPSIALDTMCSSALTAIHLACESLYRGETDMAVAGGVNLTLHPNKYLMLSQGGFLASDGKCHSYGDGGDGYVPGEGAGVIILKPLCKAKEDGDYIYGVIKGIAANHGGRTSGYTVPNPKAQTDVILDALKKANIDPRTISYVEGQGTGTPIGDTIEIAALTKAYSQYTSDKQFCSIGSAKSNIGHLESAGGIAGITKVLLQMKYQQIVPSLHAETVNPSIKFKETPFYLQHELDEWKQIELEGKRYLRRAAINSFGAGGSNVHMIIEEYENKPCVKRHNEHIILLSARNAERLKVYAKTLANYLMSDINGNSNTTITLDNIAYTLQIGREAMNERLAVHVSSTNELISALNAFIEGNIDERKMFTGNIRKNNSDISLFLEGKEGEANIRTIIQDRKLDKLARL